MLHLVCVYHLLHAQFWEVVHTMDAASKQKLLMFATGSTRAPAGGLGKLTFKVTLLNADVLW
jgi:HECT-domain (ubiquitin-transferase)